MTDAVKTLLLPLLEAGNAFPQGKALFLNAAWDETLTQALAGRALAAQQYFRPEAGTLAAHGIEARPDMPEGPFDLVLLRAPKQKAEMLHLIAEGFARLAPGGAFLCAASNDAGGTRLAPALQSLGLAPGGLSKHKARAAWAANVAPGAADAALFARWRAEGAMQRNAAGFWSQPGLFAWDRIDPGSALLLRCLPETLSGAGADFGCGPGALSAHVLQACPRVSALACIDADARAVEACRRNIAEKCGGEAAAKARFSWEDLRRPPGGVAALDFIVMNPPFHEGRKTLPEAGQAFIKTAAQALKPAGALYMVANTHLPYEATLAASFKNTAVLAAENGFKVLHATGRL
jgi:16S rRNA (guanine1207-N2)-methyltransferase